ncbi:MAG: contractile injection system protein, VgrG/Pvc8 family [Polyangiaceae bacterium]
MSSEPARLRIAALGQPRVVALRAHEGMSSLSRWHARVLWRDVGIDLGAMVGEVAALELADMDGSTRALERIIDRVGYVGPARDGWHAYELELVDFVWPLTLGSGYCIHQERTAQQVVAETLRAAGVDTARVVWRLGARYAQRVQCVQYGESDWAFVERVLADDGIAYWFEDGDRGQLLVLGDGVGAHEPIGGVRGPFADGAGTRAAQAAVHELRRVDRMTPEAVFVRDHDLRHPELPVDGAAGHGDLEHFELPSGLLVAEAAAARAAVRLQQLQRDAVRAVARTSCIRFEPGRLAQVDGVPDDLLEGEWLVAEVEHAVQPADRDAEATAYGAQVVLVPSSLDGRARPFRPAAPSGARAFTASRRPR